MSHQRAHVVIPTDLVKAIDNLVGPRQRSRFLITAAERELLRFKQLAAIKKCAGGWAQGRHPELRGGSSRFVRKLRRESDRRM